MPALLRPLAALAALLLSAGLLAACGGGDDENGDGNGSTDSLNGAADTLSTEEWAAEVRSLSEEFNRSFSGLGTEVASPESPEDYVSTVRRIEDLLAEHTANLEQLEPPAELADIQAEIVSTYEELQGQFGEIADVVEEEGTPKEIQAAAERLQSETDEIDQQLADIVERAEEQGADISNLNQVTG